MARLKLALTLESGARIGPGKAALLEGVLLRQRTRPPASSTSIRRSARDGGRQALDRPAGSLRRMQKPGESRHCHGAVGSDAAIETADIALMTDDISRLPWLVRHAKRTLAVIRQNIAFSLGGNAIFFALTFAGAATLWGAIAAGVGASLLVVLNAPPSAGRRATTVAS
jgi:hypothetical protein